MDLVGRTVAVVLLATPLLACNKLTADFSDLACGSGGACAAGYSCHPQNQVCVPTVKEDCSGTGGICPTSVRTGDACPAAGAFIDCLAGSTHCASGCRTCSGAKQWSACQVSSQCPSDLPLELCGAAPGNSAAQKPFQVAAMSCASGGIMQNGNATAVVCLGGTGAATAQANGRSWQPGPIYLMSR